MRWETVDYIDLRQPHAHMSIITRQVIAEWPARGQNGPMSTTFTTENSFPGLLKTWRQSRGISQLELALRCDSSQKHISFLESGRSRPSRTMVFVVSEALEVPLRDRNELLLAAGFAPKYRETAPTDEMLSTVTSALEQILKGNEPYPAMVFDRFHNVIQANTGALRLQMFLFGVERLEDLPEVSVNLVKGLLHPEGYGRYITNWDVVSSVMLRRLQAEANAAGNPKEALDIIEECAAYPNVPENWRQLVAQDWQNPVLTVDIEKDQTKLSFLTTLTTLGTPFDITLQEIRVESFFPADDQTRMFFVQ